MGSWAWVDILELWKENENIRNESQKKKEKWERT
jgi:hypothetical protein